MGGGSPDEKKWADSGYSFTEVGMFLFWLIKHLLSLPAAQGAWTSFFLESCSCC